MREISILVVVDMQNDFITGSLKNEEAIKILPNIVDKVKKATEDKNTLVLFTQDTHADYYLETEEGINLPIKHCIIDTWGWQIIDELLPFTKPKASKFTINGIHKFQRSPIKKPTFGSVDLGHYITYVKNCDQITIKEIEFIGVCTDICVLSNASLVKSFLPFTHVKVDASCCAGVTPDSHINALKAMKALQIEITNFSGQGGAV